MSVDRSSPGASRNRSEASTGVALASSHGKARGNHPVVSVVGWRSAGAGADANAPHRCGDDEKSGKGHTQDCW